MELFRFASLLLFVIAASPAEVTTKSGLDLDDTSKEELQRSDAGMRELMHAIFGDADLDDSVDAEEEFVELPDTGKAGNLLTVHNSSYTSKLKIVKRNRTRHRSNITCTREEYMEQLRIIVEQHNLKLPQTDNVHVKRGIKRLKNVLSSNNITTLPSCKRKHVVDDDDDQPTAGTPLYGGICTSRESYFVSLVLYTFVYKGRVNVNASEIEQLREAFSNRDAVSFYQLLHEAATTHGLPPPEKCQTFSSDEATQSALNCTILINLKGPVSFDDVMKEFEQLKGKNKQLSSPEDVHDLNRRNSNLFSTSCSGESKSKNRKTAGTARQSKLPKIVLLSLRKEKFNATYFNVTVMSNKSRDEIRTSLKTDENFYLSILPKTYSDIIKKEKRHVPAWFESLVWDEPFEVLNSSLRTNITLIGELVGEKALFFLSLYQDPQKQQMNTAISVLVIVSLMCGMLSLGCTMTFGEIMKHARKPKGVIIALSSQFVIMPAAALGLVKGFNLELYAAIAVLICGCCPGGNLSNILAYALNGDMNLSILMTTCSSVLGLGMMPFNIWAYSQLVIALDAGNVIPFANIILNIGLTLIPVFIGIMIRNFRPQMVDYIIKGGFFIMITASIGICFLAGILYEDAFFRFFPIELVAVCAILPLTGYLLGYIFAMIAREKPKCCRTIMVETGCQNVQLCTSVLRMAFDPVAINILFLMPLLYMMFQLIEAFVAVLIVRCVARSKNKGKIIENKSDDSDSFSKEFSDRESVNNKPRDNKDLLNMVPAADCYVQPNVRPISEAVDIGEAWPLQGPPTDACINSFNVAITENLV